MKTIIILLFIITSVYAQDIYMLTQDCAREYENETGYNLTLETKESIHSNLDKMIKAKNNHEWEQYNISKNKVFGFCPETISKFEEGK